MNIHEDNLSGGGQRISVELGTQLKLELDGIEIPLQSSIVGLEQEKYIIIKSPEPFQRVEHKMYAGNEMIIRYMANGTVYAFQTRIIEIITNPLCLLFIEYPKIIQHHDLRYEKRQNCHIPVRLIADEQENMGCIVDLAHTGCRCLVQGSKNPSLIKFDLDQKIIMKCIFPGSKEIVSMAGVIKNLKRNRKEIDLGINFNTNIPAASQKVITWFLAAIKDINFS